MIRRVILFIVFFGTPVAIVQSQTLPPDSWGRAASATVKAPPTHAETKRLLSIEESQQRIAQAKQAPLQGALAAAEQKLRGADFTVRLERTMDQRDVAFAQAVMLFSDDRLGGALEQAAYIHRVGKAGDVNVAAALLKSMIFLRAGVLPLARHWAEWAHKNGKEKVAAAAILKLLDEQGVGGCKLARTVPHDSKPEFKIDIWRSADSSPQSLVIVVRKEDDFRGAFALESSGTETGTRMKRHRHTPRPKATRGPPTGSRARRRPLNEPRPKEIWMLPPRT